MVCILIASLSSKYKIVHHVLILALGHFIERHFIEITISQIGHFIDKTFHRKDISQKGHFIERTFHRKGISQKGHFIDMTFHRQDISQKEEFFLQMIVFFFSSSYFPLSYENVNEMYSLSMSSFYCVRETNEKSQFSIFLRIFNNSLEHFYSTNAILVKNL